VAVGCFADQFFNTVAIHVHGGMRTAREGSLAGKVKIGVLGGTEVYLYRRVGIDKQTAAAKVRAGSNLCVSWQCKQAKRS
jgi:hypothetical protein